MSESSPSLGRTAPGGFSKRLFENSALIVIARVVTASLSLAAVPVVLEKLGVGGWGTWEALLAIGTLMTIVQSAVSGTLVWRMSEAFGTGDRAEILRLARLGVTAIVVLFCLLWPLTWVLRSRVIGLLHVPAELEDVAARVFPLVAATVLLGGLSETLEAVISGCQRSGLVPIVMAVGLIANYAVVIVAAIAGQGLWSLVEGAAVGVLVRLACARHVARLVFGSVALIPALPRRTDLSSGRYAALLMVGYASAALKDPTDKMVLAGLASATWAGYYGLASRLATLVLEIVRFFYTPLLTAVAALNAQSLWQGVRRLYDGMMTVVPVAAGAVAVVVAGLHDRLLVLWLGRSIAEVPPMLLLLLGGNTFAVILTGPGTALCRGLGRVWIETTYITAYLVLNLTLTVTLVVLVGPLGTVIASGVSWAAASVLFAVVLHRVLDLPASAMRRAAATLVCTGAAALVTRLISAAVPASGTRLEALFALGALGLVAVAVYAVLLVSTRVLSRSAFSMAVDLFGRRPSEGRA